MLYKNENFEINYDDDDVFRPLRARSCPFPKLMKPVASAAAGSAEAQAAVLYMYSLISRGFLDFFDLGLRRTRVPRTLDILLIKRWG